MSGVASGLSGLGVLFFFLSADSQNDVLKAMLTDGVKNKEALRASDYIGFSKAWAGRL
jgi:hypothetical protein